MNTGWAGIRFICHQEAYVATAYPDGPGRYSKGFGSLASGPDDLITIDDAIRAVRKHVRDNDGWIARHIKVPLSQNEWDALSSFLYQNGNKRNGRDLVVAAINAGGQEWIDLLADFDMNSNGERKSGLRRRREREISLAKNADYGDVTRYGVYAGTPPTLVETRDFPAEEPQ